ncbi:MAG TPA: hypothetical protein VM537_14320, partial [Anaerolineae bacterium]|nr:hypothetical protein [Anaerolineae bacterium]
MKRLRSRWAWVFPMTVAFLAAAFVLAPLARAQRPDTPSVEVRNMQLVGGFSDGYVGSELYLQPAYAIVGYNGGVSVLDTGSPAAPTEISHWDTPQGFPDDITADGGLVYAVVGRPIGLGGDYLQVLVRDDGNRKMTPLGKYYPPLVQEYPITGLTSIDKEFSPDYVYLGA